MTSMSSSETRENGSTDCAFRRSIKPQPPNSGFQPVSVLLIGIRHGKPFQPSATLKRPSRLPGISALFSTSSRRTKNT